MSGPASATVVRPKRWSPPGPGALRCALTFTRRDLVGYLFIAPLVAMFLVYQAWPIARALWLSFTNYKYLQPQGTRFVGLANYVEALTEDPYVLRGLWLGAAYVLLYVPLVMVASLIVAIVLDRVSNRAMSGLYRTVYYLPVVMPPVVVYVLWKWMYYPSIGLLNYFLVDTFHLLATRPRWLADPDLALPAIALMQVWHYLGYNVLLLLVGLSSINRELYEAARIDGASESRIAWHVTVPLLKPTFLVIMVLKMRTFSVVEPMLVAPGVGDSTWTWGWYAYNTAFQTGNLRMGYASAIGHLGGLLMMALVYAQYRLFRHERA
jgi:ABC-type sugar transport system permease subunit